ncbi:AGPAT3 family protein [Megaselia abdita]
MAVNMELLRRSRLIHLSMILTFFVSGLAVNIVQLILKLTVKPFNVRLHRKLNWYLSYSVFNQFVFYADWWSGSKLELFISDEDYKTFGKENNMTILNHSYEIDWLVAYCAADKFQALGGCKAFAKKVLQYVPVIGWCWYFSELIFLSRSYEKDKEIIQKQVKDIFTFPDPVCLCFYAEGTRFTDAKYAESVKFAKERGMPVLKHHLIPRTKGFTTSLPSMRDDCKSIYDMNVVFRKGGKANDPTVSNMINGKGYEACLFIRRITLDKVPEDEKKAAQWLQDLYVEKDKIIDSFHTTGSFFKTSGVKEVPSQILKPRIATFVNYMIWVSVTVLPVFYFFLKFLICGNFVGALVIGGTVGLAQLLMQQVLNFSRIDNKPQEKKA